LQSNLPTGHPYVSTCPSGNPLTSGFAGPLAWYDFSDSSTLTFVNYVSQITDKSGKGNTLSQSAVSAQPYLQTIFAQQELVFSGAQNMVSSGTNTLATGANPSSMFIVGAFNGTLTGTYALGLSYGTSSMGNIRQVGKAAGTANAYASEFNGDVNATSGWSATSALAFASFGPSMETIAVNGNASTSGTFTPNTPTATLLYLGSNSVSYFWSGAIFEALVYNSALSTAEQQFVEGYLACKWSLTLPAAHPYKSTCPTTSSPSLTVSLTVSPSGLQPPQTDLSYTTTFTNTSGTMVYAPAITSPVPANTWFKLGVAQTLGSTGLSAAVTYSNDGGASYAYAPVSWAGGAAPGYDANVTNVRWTLAGGLGPATSIASGSVTFTVRII
jgi:hypothetical protein